MDVQPRIHKTEITQNSLEYNSITDKDQYSTE